MVGGNEGQAGTGQLNAPDLDVAAEIDVIEMEDREKAGIGAAPLQVGVQIDALQPRRQDVADETAAPFVEVTEHDLGPRRSPIVHPRRQFGRLMTTLEQRGAEVNVIELQGAVFAQVNRDAL